MQREKTSRKDTDAQREDKELRTFASAPLSRILGGRRVNRIRVGAKEIIPVSTLDTQHFLLHFPTT